MRTLSADVAVVGGGLAGLATATNLARHGHDALCIEPRPWPRPAVGESLEFSAPRLLTELGLDLTRAGKRGQLFPKTSVRIIGPTEEFTIWPPPWFARPPISCSRSTYHADRTELDQEILRLATKSGVEILPQRVRRVDLDGDRIEALETDHGTSIGARWYVDGSGHNARVLGRSLGLTMDTLGQARIARWSRFREPPAGHETRLYFPEPSESDLIWAWEIPLNDDEVSVGVVMSAESLRSFNRTGSDATLAWARCFEAFPRLRSIVMRQPGVDYQSTTYLPYRYRQSVGPNWLLVGDASAMVDPLTSNGVTAALRQASAAATLVSGALEHGQARRWASWSYARTAPSTIEALNLAIESFLYEPGVRQRLGLRAAVGFYAATGVVTNALYTRLEPTSLARSVGCRLMLGTSEMWTRFARAAILASGKASREP